METGYIVGLRKLEAESLGVMVESLNLVQDQGKEALIATREGYRRLVDRLGNVLRFGARRGGLRGIGVQVPVASTTGAKGQSTVEGRIGALFRGFSRVSADRLDV